MNAVIIDDEKDARFVLRNLLSNVAPKLEILGEADSVESGVKLVQEKHPDIVFLDIRMKDGNGFDMLQKLDKQDFELIFITAYDNYAIQAFDVSATSYLLKPIKAQDLAEAISRVEKLVNWKDYAGKAERKKVLLDEFKTKNRSRIVISDVTGFKVVDLEDIVYLASDKNYTHFYMENGSRITTSRTLKSYEAILSEHGFFRIHKQYLIHLAFMQSFSHESGGMVLLKGDIELPVSRMKKKSLIEQFL